MRNGNFTDAPRIDYVYKGSYPTYEEWKLQVGTNHVRWTQYVLILPMRNGNEKKLFESVERPVGSYPTYEEWKLTNKQFIDLLQGGFLSYL